MKTWRLVSGIISLVICVFVLFQSCAVGLVNAIENNGQVSGTAGFIVAAMLIAGGVVSIATRTGGKGGNIATIILYGIGAFIGFTLAGNYSDLVIWAVWCLVCAIAAGTAFVNGHGEDDFDEDEGHTVPVKGQKEGACAKKKRIGKGMKILIVAAVAFLLLLVIGTLAGNETSKDTDSTDTVAEYGDYKAEILSSQFIPDYDGASAIKVSLSFQNNGADGLYLLESFDIRAYLDGTELDYISLNDERVETQNAIRAVKGGTSLECDMVFSLPHSGTVEFVISTPTADRVQLAKATYTYNS